MLDQIGYEMVCLLDALLGVVYESGLNAGPPRTQIRDIVAGEKLFCGWRFVVRGRRLRLEGIANGLRLAYRLGSDVVGSGLRLAYRLGSDVVGSGLRLT